jgi:ABC-2 type transport system ATP-binding protein
MTAPTVALTGLSKRYRGTVALEDISLDLRPGVTGLLGPNGAGKTTLLRILASILSPDQGRVRLLGHDPRDIAEVAEFRRHLGYLPQEMGFARAFTAAGFVEYIAVLKEWAEPSSRRAEVARVLDLVGLGDVANKRIRTLSGGQRRRVGLAQALIGAPALLVLDEPTTGLDPEQRAALRRVLSGAAEESTVVLATHQTEDVAALCQRIVLLEAGHIRYDGSVSEFVTLAAGRVWLADQPDPRARAWWRTGTGRTRNIGDAAPPGAELVEPSVEDAYLLLLGQPTSQGAPA